MTFENVLLATTLLMSGSSAKVTRCNAKNDMEPNATLVYSKSETIPDESSELNKIADYYQLKVYCEKDYPSTAIPLAIVGYPIEVFSPATIGWDKSNSETVTYSGNVSLTKSIETNVQSEFDLKGFIKLSAGIKSSTSVELSFGVSYSKTVSEETHYSMYIDGVENPFGIYVYCYSTLSASQYYVYYSHLRYNNYDKQEMYQTKLIYEDVDSHVYLPGNNAFLLKPFHLDNYSDYQDFINKYNL